MKNEIRLNDLINKDKYQVFLFRCKAHFPLNFADHLWFVINIKGEVSRWEVLYSNDYRAETHWGHLYKNFHRPFQGINIFNFFKKPTWKSELLHKIEGDENSTAGKMANFISNSNEQYPYCNKYSLLGPNCGTYVQWILKKFPEFNFKLKNYTGINYNK
ncbi:MAG: DUF3750 domain-containing protein [Candidatus Pacebacteria bacterium]|nr:DUF3750 domain-containing protein [Candidatus Paceibacterota bacterium]